MIASSVLVVEPHADDAFLSVGQHIEDWVKQGIAVTILTVFSGTRKRAGDAQAYAQAVGAKWIGGGFVEREPLVIPPDWSILPAGAQMILPLALTHQEHVDVRKAYDHASAWYYLDQPYAITQKNGELITELLDGKPVVSYRKPVIRKYRHAPLFKDQAKFYHYNPPEKLIQSCELIVRNSAPGEAI